MSRAHVFESNIFQWIQIVIITASTPPLLPATAPSSACTLYMYLYTINSSKSHYQSQNAKRWIFHNEHSLTHSHTQTDPDPLRYREQIGKPFACQLTIWLRVMRSFLIKFSSFAGRHLCVATFPTSFLLCLFSSISSSNSISFTSMSEPSSLQRFRTNYLQSSKFDYFIVCQRIYIFAVYCCCLTIYASMQLQNISAIATAD